MSITASETSKKTRTEHATYNPPVQPEPAAPATVLGPKSTRPASEHESREAPRRKQRLKRDAHGARAPPAVTLGNDGRVTSIGEALIGKRELAKFLGLSLSGLQKQIARGIVAPYVRVGNMIRWAPAVVREFYGAKKTTTSETVMADTP